MHEMSGAKARARVGIIVPTYNYGRFLDDCLSSVHQQGYSDYEVLIIDNASEDDTETIARRWTALDARFRYVRNETNLGPRESVLKAYELIESEFALILCADDCLAPAFLEQTVEALDRHPECTFAYTGWQLFVDRQGQENHGARIDAFVPHRSSGVYDEAAVLLSHNWITLSVAVFRRSICDVVGGLSPQPLQHTGDWYLWMRLAARGPAFYIHDTLGYYRVHGQSETNRLIGGNLSGHDHLHFYDLIYGSDLWPLPIRLLARAHQMRWLTGEPFAAVVRKMGGEQAHSVMRQFVADARDDVHVAAARCILDYTPTPNCLDTAENALALLKEVLQRQPLHPEATALVADQQTALSNLGSGGTRPPLATDSALTPPEYALIAARAATPADAPCPRFTIVVDARPDPAALDLTLTSIEGQIVRPDRILVVGAGGPVALPSDRAAYVSLAALHQCLHEHCSAPGEWVMCLAAGDVLTEDALHHASRSIEAQPQAVVVYFDHDEIGDDGRCRNPHFKPDANPDLLRSYPYTGRALLARGDRLAGTVDAAPFDLASCYELALRAVEAEGERGLAHVPTIIGHLSARVPAVWVRAAAESQALERVLRVHASRMMPGATTMEGPVPGTFHLLPPLHRTPLVSIIIPTKDQLPLLKRCLESLLEKTSYPNFEILIVDNDSESSEARQFLDGMGAIAPDRIRVLRQPGPFNFSAMNNRAAELARGDFLLLLNNDTAAIQSDWLSYMMRHALRDDVGIVGAGLFFPDGRIQHAGVVLGLRGPAEHPFVGLAADAPGYLRRAQVQQNYSAVTGACLLVRKSLYRDVGGLDEEVFAVSYNDIDFCLKVRQRGKLVVWTPLAIMLHESSASQLSDTEKLAYERKVARFKNERAAMYARWRDVIANDPAYNPNLSRSGDAFSLETNPLLRFDRVAGLADHRVLAFLTDTPHRGRYRIIQPLEAMREAGLASGGVLDDLIDVNLALRSGADTLVFQQPRSEHQLLMMEALLDLADVVKVFDGDDLIWNPPFRDMPRDALTQALITRMEQAIRRCDRLVVSNDRLARQLAGIHDDIRVAPDALHPALWGDTPICRVPDSPGHRARVGCVVDGQSDDDIEVIADVIRELAGEIDWVFLGACPPRLRPFVAECVDDMSAAVYPSRLMAQNWDLAVAPLADTANANYGSNVRVLEYGWSGFPVVCSDLRPYQGDLPLTRVANRREAWITAIRAHLANADWSRCQGAALQQAIARDWVLTGDRLHAWHALWTAPTAPQGATTRAATVAPRAAMASCPDAPVPVRTPGVVASQSSARDVPIEAPQAPPLHAARPAPGEIAITAQRAQGSFIESLSDSYRCWVGRRRLVGSDLALLARLMNETWPYKPSVHLFLRVQRPQFPLLARTLESLNAQFYGNWRADVISTEPSPGDALDGLAQLAWHTVSAEGDMKAAIDLLVATRRHDWICELPPGAALDPLCLFRIAHAAATTAAAGDAFFADDDLCDAGGLRHSPRLKPDFDLDWVRSSDLTGPVFVKTETWRTVGGASAGANRPWYDLILRVAEKCATESIVHVAEPLISLPAELADQAHAVECRAAVARHLKRLGLTAHVQAVSDTVWHVRHAPAAAARVTIAIPSLDRPEMLAPCIDTILSTTLYPDYEILVVDGGSTDGDTLALHSALQSRSEAPVRVVRLTTPMNAASAANLAAREATGDFLLLLGDDVRVLTADWLNSLMRHAVRDDVAAVGPRIVSPPTGLIDQAGYILAIDGLGGTPHRGKSGADDAGYLDILQVDRTVAGLPGACMLMRRDDFLEAGGMDEAQLAAAHADIDFSLRLARQTGRRCVTTAGVTVVKTGGSCLDPVFSWAIDTAAHELAKRKAQETLLRRWFEEFSSVRFWSRHLDRTDSTPRIELRCVPSWHALPLAAPRILGFPVQNAQGEIRIARPLNALREAGKALPCIFRPIDKESMLPTAYDLARHKPDAMVTHHPIGQSSLVAIRQWREFLKNIFIVYAVDDLLTDMPLKSSLRQGIPADARSYLARGLEYCDRLVVSTAFLAERYGGFAKDVRIVPNRLERDLWLPLSTQRRTTARPRIGWAGGTAHEGDLQLIAEVIAATANEVDWIFMGMCPDNIRPHVKEFHPFGDFEQYPARLAALSLDIAVAPLEQIPFNRGKSNLRLLEYGALGIPVVCTDIDPYRDSPACKVANRPQAWLEALRARIHDPDAAQREGQAMREWVLKHYILEEHLDDWLQAHLPG